MPYITTNEPALPAFFDMTLDLVCVASKEGYFKEINQAVVEKLGYTKEELMSRPIASFIHPEDRERTASVRNSLLNGQALTNFQNRYLAKNGTAVWLEWTSVYFPDQEIVFAIAKDVTSRKIIEQEITERYEKFKSLAVHFKNRIERDRKYLAIELHEELAQLAAVVKFELDALASGENSLTEDGRKKLEQALALSQLLINTIRRISFSISPAMLNDIGLVETLEWHCREFSRISSIPCTFKGHCNEDKLTMEAKLDIFRICQEALHNVLYHAEASSAALTITEKEDTTEFVITDNGKGFDPLNQEDAHGLINMRQLAASLNGNLSISSGIGKGTRVCLQLKK